MKRAIIGTLSLLMVCGLFSLPEKVSSYQGQANSPEQIRLTADFEDAPVRPAAEMLLQASRQDYSIDPNVFGYVTVRFREKAIDAALPKLLEKVVLPVAFRHESGVYIVGVFEYSVGLGPIGHPEYYGEKDLILRLPHRVAGIVSVTKSGVTIPISALIMTYGELSPSVSIVRVGDAFPSNKHADYMVKAITQKGVVLESNDNEARRFEIPLRKAVLGKPKEKQDKP